MTDWKERAERAEAELARLRAQEPEYWQWRRKRDPWEIGKTFNSQVYATTADSEVRCLYAAPPAQPAEQQAQTVCKRTLIEIDARLRECSIVGASAADAYDTFYQHMVETALAAQPAEPVQRLSDAGIEALAGKHGTTYRNRHFPTQPAFSFSNGSLHRFVRDIESAIQPQPGWRDIETPQGWKLVPVEPSVEMRRAAAPWIANYHMMRATDKTNALTDAYQAMLKAAPKATK